MTWSDHDMRLQRLIHLPGGAAAGNVPYRRLHLKLRFNPHDLWIGLYWVHDVQGWDGGWWESWRFYLILVPTLPLRLIVDRSNRDTRALRRWGRANPETYQHWRETHHG